MKYLAEVFDQLGVVAWKDKEGHFLGMNQMGLDVLGVKIGDVVGKKDEDFFPMELVEGYRKDDKEVLKTGRKKYFKEKVTDKDGNYIEMHVKKTPLRDQQGNIVGVIVLAIQE